MTDPATSPPDDGKVTFQPGAFSAQIDGAIEAQGAHPNFSVDAESGQFMVVNIFSLLPNSRLRVRSSSLRDSRRANPEASSWPRL